MNVVLDDPPIVFVAPFNVNGISNVALELLLVQFPPNNNVPVEALIEPVVNVRSPATSKLHAPPVIVLPALVHVPGTIMVLAFMVKLPPLKAALPPIRSV